MQDPCLDIAPTLVDLDHEMEQKLCQGEGYLQSLTDKYLGSFVYVFR